MRRLSALAIVLLSRAAVAAPPPPLPPPALAACAYERPRDDHTWSLRLGSSIYAWVKGAVRLSLPVTTEATFASATFEIGGVKLSGSIAADEIELHPTRAFVVGQVIVPRAPAVFRWTDAARGRIGFVFMPASLLLSAGHARVTRPCADLTLVERPFDPSVAVKPSGKGREGWLGGGKTVALASTPEGAPLAELVDGLGVWPLTVLQTRGDRTRITWEGSDVLAFGWVPTNRLARARPSPIELKELGSPSARPAPANESRAERIACAFALPLVAEAGRDLRTVGSVGAGVPFERGLGDDRDGLTSVRFNDAEIEVAEGARLLVPAKDLGRCKVSPPQRRPGPRGE